MVQLFYKSECDLIVFIKETFKDDDEAVFVVGGDGTYLKALSAYKLGEVPLIYGFNTGTVGALIPFSSSQVQSLVSQIKERTLPCLIRSRFYVSSHGICVANDLIIYSKAHGLARFNIYINGENIKINGDGITIATKSGSTGHNFSIAGPVLLMEGIIINCSAPNRCNFRPLIVSLDSKIKIETFGCAGLFDNQVSIESDVFEINGWDNYKVAVPGPVEELAIARRQFTLE